MLICASFALLSQNGVHRNFFSALLLISSRSTFFVFLSVNTKHDLWPHFLFASNSNKLPSNNAHSLTQFHQNTIMDDDDDDDDVMCLLEKLGENFSDPWMFI